MLNKKCFWKYVLLHFHIIVIVYSCIVIIHNDVAGNSNYQNNINKATMRLSDNIYYEVEMYLIACTNCNIAKNKNEVKKHKLPGKCQVHFCNLNTNNNYDHNHYLCISCYNEIKISVNLGERLNMLKQSLKNGK